MINYTFGATSAARLNNVHPDLVRVLWLAIHTSGDDFSVLEGVRTAATQQKYYSWGRTALNPNTGKLKGLPLGAKVTTRDGVKKPSEHQVKADGYGHAVDIAPFIGGRVRHDDIAAFNRIAAHIKSTAQRLGISITWGGDWKTLVDRPHFELKR